MTERSLQPSCNDYRNCTHPRCLVASAIEDGQQIERDRILTIAKHWYDAGTLPFDVLLDAIGDPK